MRATPSPGRVPTARRLNRLIIALPVAAILGYIVYWFAVAGAAEHQVTAWIDAQRARGFEVRHDGIETGGFPFRVTVTIDKPVMSRPGDKGWSWAGPAVVLSGVPWSLERLNWLATGEHRFTRTIDGQTALLDAAGLEGWVEIVQGRLSKWEAWLTGGQLATAGGQPVVQARGLLIQHLPGTDDETATDNAATKDTIKPRLPLTIDAKGLRVAEGTGGPLGDEIDRLTLDLSLNGPLTPGPWPKPALDWRDAGGVLEVKSLGLSYGPLNLAADGTLAIDRAGQPMGAFATRITGFAETIDALNQAGLMDRGAAATAQIVLGLLAKGPANGPKRLDVPVSLQDRTVTLGSVKLFRLKAVPWFTAP